MATESRLFDHDAERGITRIFHYDTDTEESTIETISDVTDIVESNRRQFNNVDERAGYKGDLHKIGSIPMSLYFQLKEQGIMGDQARLKKWLNDPDNRFFRTRPGTV